MTSHSLELSLCNWFSFYEMTLLSWREIAHIHCLTGYTNLGRSNKHEKGSIAIQSFCTLGHSGGCNNVYRYIPLLRDSISNPIQQQPFQNDQNRKASLSAVKIEYNLTAGKSLPSQCVPGPKPPEITVVVVERPPPKQFPHVITIYYTPMSHSRTRIRSRSFILGLRCHVDSTIAR